MQLEFIHSSVICQTTGPQPVIIISNLSDTRQVHSLFQKDFST
jgi:hypothetical protein